MFCPCVVNIDQRHLNSIDISFDEDFVSTVAYSGSQFSSGLPLQLPPSMNPTDPPDVPYTGTLTANSPFIQHPVYSPDDSPIEDCFHETLVPLLEGETPNYTTKSTKSTKAQLRQSKPLKPLQNVLRSCYNTSNTDLDMAYMKFAFDTEVTDELAGISPDDFLPAPANRKSILKMTERQRKQWLKSLHSESKLLIVTIQYFKDTTNKTDPKVPTTSKSTTKLKSDGTTEKQTAHICLRGDKQTELADFDTWCPIGNFRDLKLFLTFAAHYKRRVHQLDFIGAFLQVTANNRTFTTLPVEW